MFAQFKTRDKVSVSLHLSSIVQQLLFVVCCLCLSCQVSVICSIARLLACCCLLVVDCRFFIVACPCLLVVAGG